MKRIVLSSIIALIIVGLMTAGYFFYRRYSGDVAEVIRAVPPDAAFVIECRNAQTSLFNLRQTDYWQTVSNAPSSKVLAQTMLHIDSVFTADAHFASIWKNKPIVISAHVTKADDFDWLFLFEVPRGADEDDVSAFLKKALSLSGQATKHEYQGVYIYEIAASSGRTFSFALTSGILMCSYTSFLVEDATRQLKNGSSLKSDKSFFSVYKSSGKNTDADVYCNYSSFSRFLGIFSGQQASSFLSLSSSLAEWSEADIKFNASSVLMSGYTAMKDTSQLMAVMANQQPQENRMASILPARTAYLFHIGVSNPADFLEHLQFSSFGNGEAGIGKEHGPGNGKVAAGSGRKRRTASERAAAGTISSLLTAWMGHEMALVITESNTGNYSNNTFACIEARDTAEAMHALKEACSSTEPVQGAPCKTEFYNGHEIGLIKSDNILMTVYGRLFEGVQKNFFTIIGNYVVFANQVSSLRSFIDDADSKKTLASDAAYKKVLANSDASSNAFIYINISRSLNMVRPMLSNAALQTLGDANNWINPARSGLSAIALQYSNKNGLLYNHFVFQFYEEEKKNVSRVWSAECDTSVHAKPQVVTDGSNTYFMVQDDANRLYLFDESGQLAWKKEMGEKILSDIYSIDFFHNGTQQFLFNTTSSLYLVDKSGAYIGNYPIRLPGTASNGCTVVDFDNNSDYKIFVACTNQVLYAYEAGGKTMSGWQYNKPVGNITTPVKYFKVKGKDYLLLVTTDGKIELLDRQGGLRARAAVKIAISPSSDITAVDTDDVALAHVVLADTSGSVFNIYTSGLAKKIFTNHFTSPVFFSMTDVNGDGKPDYVLFANNVLTVNSGSDTTSAEQNAGILYTHEMRDAQPGLFVTTSGGLIGSIAPAINELTIYNSDGTLYPGFPVKGSTAFAVTPRNTDDKRYVAVGSSDGNLYLYVVE